MTKESSTGFSFLLRDYDDYDHHDYYYNSSLNQTKSLFLF